MKRSISLPKNTRDQSVDFIRLSWISLIELEEQNLIIDILHVLQFSNCILSMPFDMNKLLQHDRCSLHLSIEFLVQFAWSVDDSIELKRHKMWTSGCSLQDSAIIYSKFGLMEKIVQQVLWLRTIFLTICNIQACHQFCLICVELGWKFSRNSNG